MMHIERRYRCEVFDRENKLCCERIFHSFTDCIAIERAAWFLTRGQCGRGIKVELWRGPDKLFEKSRCLDIL